MSLHMRALFLLNFLCTAVFIVIMGQSPHDATFLSGSGRSVGLPTGAGRPTNTWRRSLGGCSGHTSEIASTGSNLSEEEEGQYVLLSMSGLSVLSQRPTSTCGCNKHYISVHIKIMI